MTTLRSGTRYRRPLQALLARLAILHGTLWQLVSHLDARSEAVKESINRARAMGRPKSYGAAAYAHFIIGNLSEPSRRLVPVASYERTGAQVVAAIREMVAINSAWTVAQGYEAFETFALDTTAAFLCDARTESISPNWQGRRRSTQSIASYRQADMRRYVRECYRGAEDVLPRLRKSLPALTVIERDNNRTVDIGDWIRVVGAVRHAVVHNKMVLTPRQVQRLGANNRALLNRAFPGKHSRGSYALHFDRSDAELALRLFGEYAFAIQNVCADATKRSATPLGLLHPARGAVK